MSCRTHYLFSNGAVDISIRILQVTLVTIKDEFRSEHALSGPGSNRIFFYSVNLPSVSVQRVFPIKNYPLKANLVK